MDSPAAIPPAWLRHSKHLQLNQPTLTAVINAGILVVLSCRWAGPRPRLDTRGHGWAIACLTTLYDIAIHWPTISWYNFFLTIRALCWMQLFSCITRCIQCIITSAEEGGYVITSVSLSVWPSDNWKSWERILTKFLGEVGHDKQAWQWHVMYSQ